MTRLKRQDIFLTLVFTMIFVFAFSVSGYSSEDPLNRPPVADAGPDQTVESTSPSGADITLDGSSSFDLDGDALTYLWTWNASSATGVNPTIFLLLGTTTVTLQVDDGNGGTAIDTVTVKVVLSVPVDIKPMSCPNPLNVKSKGVLPVAILGTADFDVTQVDIATVSLAGVQAIPDKYEMEDVATPFNGVSSDDCHDCTEDGPDGFMDLTLYFDSQELVADIGDVNDGDCLSLTLTGALLDGTPITIIGTDSLLIKKK
jgi:hypothetical protein